MIPSSVANQVRATLLDYLRTTTSFQDPEIDAALTNFLEAELFKGPYIDLRLPFRKAQAADDIPLEVAPSFTPYVHQLEAFRRLTTQDEHQPQPTLITTGTGSGKTECFLFPILDHCYRRRSMPGIKAIILYPMNALASDQARRLAAAIHQDERLRNHVTAGIYVGGDLEENHTSMGPDWLIDDREVMRRQPPDILLTNFKMLDFLLLRPEDKPLWAQNGPETLRYLVLDELHTYDGAQGSDVAGLVRRVRARLQIPEGALCPVGTSATIGSGGAGEAGVPDTLLKFAANVFGVAFDKASMIGENRITAGEFLATAPTRDALPRDLDALVETPGEAMDSYLTRVYDAWFLPPDGESPRLPDAVEVGAVLRSHTFFHALVTASAGHIAPWATLCSLLAARDPDFAALLPDQQGLVIDSFLALVAYARSNADGRVAPLLTLQVQLWIREMTRLMRAVGPKPDFFWRDDHPEQSDRLGLPAYICRECGHSGWVAFRHDGDKHLTDDVERIYRAYFDRSQFMCYVHPGTRPDMLATVQDRLCTSCLRISYATECPDCDLPTLPVVVQRSLSQPAGAAHHPQDLRRCPLCDADDALSIIGAQAASLASVAISHLFTAPLNGDKKLLAFTDSVQDASHRAAFYGARTYRFNLRTATQAALIDATSKKRDCDTKIVQPGATGVALTHLHELMMEYWRCRWQEDPRREQQLVATFMPADLNDRPAYRAYMRRAGGSIPPQVESELMQRLAWEMVMQFGFNAQLGRSLEKVGSAVAHLSAELLESLTPRLHLRLSEEFGMLAALEPAQVRHFLTGFVERLRTRGGVDHPFLRKYILADGSWFQLTKSMQPLLSPFHKNSPRFPKFLVDQSPRNVFDSYISKGGRTTWYLDWAHRTLAPALDAVVANDIYRLVVQELVRAELLAEYSPAANRHVYALRPESLEVTPFTASVRCDACNLQRTVAHADIPAWIGQACLNYRCMGRFQEDAQDNQYYYRALYARGHVKRIFAHEHTGLLEREVREQLEKQFSTQANADAPNLLVATPTLEMGIDIGDLSAAMATSVPPTTSNYLQRIGRAGRKTGNSLILTLALGRPHDLYFYAEPLEMMAGAVGSPGCYLDAPLILQRHFLAFCMDAWVAHEAQTRDLPRNVQYLLAADTRGHFPQKFLAYVERQLDDLLTEFFARYGDAVGEATRDRVINFIRQNGIAVSIYEAIQDARKERDKLRSARTELLEQIKRIEADQAQIADAEQQIAERRRDIRLILDMLKRVDEQYILNFFTDAGLLPNYAFPESGVKFKAIITDLPAQESERSYEVHEFVRSAPTALRELAPFNKFYAFGRKMTVDQIELPEPGNALERWQFCNRCSHMELVQASHFKPTCPMCGSVQWSDVGQQHAMIRLRQASARDKHYTSLVGDDDDEREQERFQTATAFELKQEDSGGAHLIADLPFGIEYFQTVTLREVNFGSTDAHGPQVQIADEDRSFVGFQICSDCGAVKPPGTTAEDDAKQVAHSFQCKSRKPGKAPEYTDVYLYRELTTEALRILLPVSTTLVQEKLATFAASLHLGLQRYLGGDPNHLNIAQHTEVGFDGTQRRYLLIYDTVPGGTSYLADLARPDNFCLLLQLARDALASCECRNDPSKRACYRCLYSYQAQRTMQLVSRRDGLQMVQAILSVWAEMQPVPSLSDVDMHSVLESELEQRIVEAMEHYAARQKAITWRQTLVNGKPGWLMTVNGQPWRVEAQVLLGNAYGVAESSRADFVFWPDGAHSADIRPVAVFTDGFAYHAQPHKPISQLADDLLKRRSLMESGRFRVWSITWDDVEEFRQSEKSGWSAYFSETVGKVRAKLEPKSPEDKPFDNACTQLLSYLGGSGEALWQSYAQSWPVALVVGETRPPIDEELAEATLRQMCIEPEMPDLAIQPVAPHGATQYGVVLSERMLFYAYIARAALTDKAFDQVAGVLRLDDVSENRRQAYFKQFWRRFWLLGNVMQFVPRFRLVSSEFVTAFPDAAQRSFGVDSIRTEDSATAAAWDEALAFVAPDCQSLVRACRENALPIPEVGYELTDERGMVIGAAELAWPDEGIAVFPEALPSEDSAEFEAAGWKALHFSDLEKIVQALRATTSVR